MSQRWSAAFFLFIHSVLPCGHLAAAHMVLDQRANLPVVMGATLPMEPLSALLVLNLTESSIEFEVARFRDAPQVCGPLLSSWD